MPWTLSTEVEAALRAAAERELPSAVCAGAALRQAVHDRSERYTTARERMGAPLPARARAGDLAAHALFFAVADAAKIMIPLAELHGRGLERQSVCLTERNRGVASSARRDEGAGYAPATEEQRRDAPQIRGIATEGKPIGALDTARPVRVLDVGAGPGAMTLGTLDFLHRIGSRAAVSVHAVDLDSDALAILRRAVADLAERWNMDISLTTASADITGGALAGDAYDLVLAGSVLNEIDPARRRDVLAAMIEATSERGAIVVIEPALRETARDLHVLRDWVLEEGRAHVFAPCVRQGASCPALEDERDWCHEDRPVILPERTAQMAAASGLRGHGLKFAYLTLCRTPAAQIDMSAVPSDTGRALRVVSQLRSSKGKHECYGCSDEGRLPVRLLRRNRSLANRDFERARRGDVLLMPRASGDLQKDDQVTLVRATMDDSP